MTDFLGILTKAVLDGDDKQVVKTIQEELEEAGLKSKVKVMIGGAPVTRAYADETGAEGFAEDCASAVDEAHRLMELK